MREDGEQSFTAEAIERQTAGHSSELAPAESHLVQQIYTLSEAYAQENEQSLERIWTRLRQSQEHFSSPWEKQFFAEGKTMQNHDLAPVDVVPQPTTMSRPAGQPPRRSRRIFTLAAALLIATLLLGSALVIFTNVHQAGSTLIGTHAATPTHPATGTPATTFVPFPAQDCPVDKPENDASWSRLCQAGKFVLVNQTRSLKHGQSANIKAAYADRNELFLIYDVSPFKATDLGFLFSTVTTLQGTQLVEEGILGGSVSKQHSLAVANFNTSNLPANLPILTVKVSLTVTSDGPGKVYKVDFPFMRIPLHEAQVIRPDQTRTVNGVTFTLTKVIIGASGARFSISAPNMPFNVYNNGFLATLQTGKQKLGDPDYPNYSLIGNTPPSGFEFLFHRDLSTEHGTWTLTITQSHAPTIPQPSGMKPLVFHFTV